MTKHYFFFFFFLLSLLFATSISAQIVATTPTFPVESEAVSIIFDATKGTAGLKGFTGEVYAHTGVITDKSTSSSDWKYAPTWGNNAAKYKLESLGNDQWKLNITPDIRTYYGVATGETIKQMAFVFRSADTTKEGKDTGGADIFVDVHQNAFTIRLDLPAEGAAFSVNEVCNIKATASQTATLTLFVDNQQISTATNATEINGTHTFTQAGTYTIKAESKSGTLSATVTRQIMILGTTEELTMPAGVRPGINYHSDNTKATLVLQAPGKKNVFVVGDFNDWQPLTTYQLKRDGEYFWITLSNLTAGTEYAFQYLVDGSIYIADPYTEKVLDPWHDQYIEASVYPNLKAYPTGKTKDGIVSVLQTAQQPYNWKTTNFVAPDKNQLIIYELLIRDFTSESTYKAAIEKLDYLQALGVNAIELLPVNEFDGNSSWGYNPAFYFAPDKYYGTKDDLKQFIDECHARGMAVILDIVLNHSTNQSPFLLLYQENWTPTSDNPWYNVASNIANPGLQFGADFNHESSYTKALVDSVASFWMSEYQVDGFRYDFTKGFSNTPYPNVSDWASAYDAARIAILKRMASEVWKRNPDAYVIFEHLTGAQEEKELGEEGIMLWRNMNHAYCQSAMGFQTESAFTGVYAGTTMPAGSLIGYMESHDEERMGYKALTYGDGNLRTYLSERIKLAKTNAAFFFTVPGPKMIWQFGELNYDYSIDYNERTGEKPVKWDYFGNTYRKDLYNTYSALLDLRNSYPELFSSNADFSWKVTANDWTNGRYITSVADEKAMVIVGNFTSVAGTYSVTFPRTGKWTNYMDETDVLNLASTTQTITIPARDFRLYLNFDALTGIEDITPDSHTTEAYYDRAADQIIVASGEAAKSVEVYSIGGVMVMRQENVSSMGLSPLSAGYYIARVTLGNGKQSVYKIVR